MIYSPVGQAAPPTSRIAMDSRGNLYLADTGNHRIRKIDPNGIITTVAGNGSADFSGDGGPATAAALRFPTDVDVDSEGNVYIADTFNSCIRKVDTQGIITTFAGKGDEPGFEGDGGSRLAAKLDRPYGIAFDSKGNFYIADTHNHRIRVILK
jgi:DNA-binding beta-propeller fold protein YncE